MKAAQGFRDKAKDYTERYRELCGKWGLEPEEFEGIL
jgi:acyl-CoA dehydrogenase